MAAGDDDWAVLGIPPRSSLDVARAAYVRRAHLLHPDRHPDATPCERARLTAAMAALNLAWERIEAGATTPSAAMPSEDGLRGSDPAPEPARTPDADRMTSARGRETRAGEPVTAAPVPDGFVRSLALQRADRWSLRLWTDDLEPLHLLCHHRTAPVVGALDLHGRPIHDRHLTLLSHLPALEVLDLSDTEVTDAGLHRLAILPQLRQLALSGTSITDRGLFALAACTRLTSLSLCDTAVTGAGLEVLAPLPLALLNLRGTAVDGQALAELATWPALRLLVVPRLERSARYRFQRARPDVSLV